MGGAGFLQDGAGNNSSMRLVVVLSILIIMVVWAAISIRSNTLAPIPTEVAAVLATMVAGKIGQAWVDNTNPPPSNLATVTNTASRPGAGQ